MLYPQYVIDDLKVRADLVRLIQPYAPDLKKKGANWMACCPFHQEKTPSFSVNPGKGFYKCFGCGKGGTAFNFPNDVPHFDQYIASVRRLAVLAAGANATIDFNNQSQFNGAATKLRMLKDRHPGEAHPLVVGTNAVARYFKIEDECAQAVRLKMLAASGGKPQ